MRAELPSSTTTPTVTTNTTPIHNHNHATRTPHPFALAVARYPSQLDDLEKAAGPLAALLELPGDPDRLSATLKKRLTANGRAMSALASADASEVASAMDVTASAVGIAKELLAAA